jgi:hypothetical protein
MVELGANMRGDAVTLGDLVGKITMLMAQAELARAVRPD